MASHAIRNNAQRQHRKYQQDHLHRSHYPWIYSSCRRPEAAMDDQIPASEAAHQVP